jgi:hypothetical protein
MCVAPQPDFGRVLARIVTGSTSARSPELPAAKLQQDNRVHHVAASSASAGTWKTISNLTRIRPHRHAHTALQFYRPKSAPRAGTLRGVSRVPQTPGNVADMAMAVPPAWSRRQTKAAATKLTMPTACANGSNKGRSRQSFHRQPHDGRPILWTARPTNAETSSNACSASLKTGDASQPDMTAMRKTISLASLSQP